MCCRGGGEYMKQGWVGRLRGTQPGEGRLGKVFPECLYFPCFPSLPILGHQSAWVTPTSVQRHPVQGQNCKSMGHKTPNKFGWAPSQCGETWSCGQGHFWLLGLQGVGSEQQRALGSLGQLSVWVGDGERFTPLSPGLYRSTGAGQHWAELMGRLESGRQFH